MDSYLVPAGYGEAEYIDKKSRFIGRVWPVESESEAQAHIREMRSKYADATHNVWAYLLRDGTMRYSDDGEPGGTSGQPTLNVFRAGEVYDVCCVVTRYFGGILLGSGGLVRAYSSTARMALEAAGLARMALWRCGRIACGYGKYEQVRRLLEDYGAAVENTEFAADVRLSYAVPDDRADTLLRAALELTAGTAVTEELGTAFRGVPLA